MSRLKLTNTILLKDDTGKAKLSHFDLPNQKFYYGQPNPIDEENAQQVTLSWQFHSQSAKSMPHRNFKALNKVGIA